MEEVKPKPKPKRTPKVPTGKPTPKAIIVMFKSGPQIGSIEVDTMDQAKAVQGTLNDWLGSHTLTKFIYV